MIILGNIGLLGDKERSLHLHVTLMKHGIPWSLKETLTWAIFLSYEIFDNVT